MTLRRGLAAALLAASLSGCANVSLPTKPPDTAVSAPPQHAQYRLEVQAPDALRKLLTNYLDLARFQSAPATESVDAAELERLMRAAPAQARELLETEGYFNATVTVPAASADAGLPLVRVIAEPGPRATVGAFTLEAVGDLQTSGAAHELELLRKRWPLPVGAAFGQGAWTDAKNLTLARLRADGFAAASWQRTSARVDAAANRVELALVIDSGPRFHIGALRVEGLQRYEEDSVRQLANFGLGDSYSEKLLLDFQERIQKLGLFEGASVELDADPAHASAAAVIVHVKELALHQATIGIGYSANTGPRVTLEHTDRRLFASDWIAHNKFELGPTQQTWGGELTSHPLADLYRNLLSGSATRLLANDQTLRSWNARVGRTQDTPLIERLYFGEFVHARVDSALLISQADAASYNYNWVYRDIDNVLLPTRGLTTSLQAALGFARGSQAVQGNPIANAQGPFARLYARLTWYRPFGDAWYGTARVEGGQVFTRDVIDIPDTLLFRAGGDDSVRGYAYRTLAPNVGGVAVGGRSLFTTSLEIARPIAPSFPAYWWAAFIDAGNAADSVHALTPELGYGVGLRWRSPVGPLRVDVAYGQQVKQVRTHLSVGIAF